MLCMLRHALPGHALLGHVMPCHVMLAGLGFRWDAQLECRRLSIELVTVVEHPNVPAPLSWTTMWPCQ